MIQSGAKLLPSLLCICTGCATIQTRSPVTSDEVISRRNRHVVPSAEWKAAASVSESRVAVEVVPTCNVVEDVEIKRTTTAERYNASAKLDYWLGAAGVASTALGVGYLVDAPNVYPNDTTSRTYNAYGPETARTAAYVLLGTGAVLLAIPIIDAVRASGEEVTTSLVREPQTVATGVACGQDATPPESLDVGVRVGRLAFPAGQTDSDGRLEFDLADVIPERLPIKPNDKAVIVINETKTVATVNLQALLHARERRAWEALRPDDCLTYPRGSACAGIRHFVSQYPNGAYSLEAERILKTAALIEEEMAVRAREAAARARAEREAAAESARIEWEMEQRRREAAAAEARKRAETAARAAAECKNKCSVGCKGNKQCISACVSAKCR